MAPPVTRSNGIGLTEDQYADMNRQVEAGYLASQGEFNDQMQRDVRQQQFQVSLQRDIERSLSNNPEFSVSVPVPRAEFATPSAPTISRQARLDRDLMNYAIDGGIGTSSFNRPIENAFDAQLSDAQLFDPLAPKVVDLRPTRENAIAMGYEQRADYYPHVTAELRPWDPGSAARAKLAGNAIGSMLMNPLGAVGYLGTLAAGGSEEVAFRNAIIGGAGGDVILGLGAPLGVRGPAALVRSTELEIAAAAGTRSPVLFGQRRLSETFGADGRPSYLAGRTINDVANDLARGVLSPDQLPITAFEYGNGQLVSANTRSIGSDQPSRLIADECHSCRTEQSAAPSATATVSVARFSVAWTASTGDAEPT